MSAQSDAQTLVSTHLRGGLVMKPPTGHTTKTVNGQPQVVSASEAWDHSSTNQSNVPTIKTFLNAIAVELQKRGDPGRAQAVLVTASQI